MIPKAFASSVTSLYKTKSQRSLLFIIRLPIPILENIWQLFIVFREKKSLKFNTNGRRFLPVHGIDVLEGTPSLGLRALAKRLGL